MLDMYPTSNFNDDIYTKYTHDYTINFFGG